MEHANLSKADLTGAIFSPETSFNSADMASAKNVDKMVIVDPKPYHPRFVNNDDGLLGASGFVAQLATAVGGGIADEAVSTGIEIADGAVESLKEVVDETLGSEGLELANEAVESLIDDEELMNLLEEGVAKDVKGLRSQGTKAFVALSK